jgi:hypothetical protein
MALILLDGCEDLTCWTAYIPTIGAGRNGNCFQFAGTINNSYYTVPAAQEADTFTVGFAVKFGSLPASTSDFFALTSDATATAHVSLRLTSTGSIDVGRSSSAGFAILGSSVAGLLNIGVWYYVELQAKLSDTVGTAIVRVNGVTVIGPLSNLDTKNNGTKTTFDSISLRVGSATTPYFDDLYLMSGTGDTFLGDIVIETLYPNGNGNANQWVGSDADSVNNYLLVDEVGVPDTTDYVADSVSGHQDMYTLTDLVHSTGTIVGVCHSAYLAKTDAVNLRQVRIVNRRAADNKTAALTLATTYVAFQYMLPTDPETSAAWTIANVNALQSGVEVV